MIVGRDRELGVAREFLGGVTESARALLIEGEPGIGKTAVWQAVLSDAADAGHRVLSCTGTQAEAAHKCVYLFC